MAPVAVPPVARTARPRAASPRRSVPADALGPGSDLKHRAGLERKGANPTSSGERQGGTVSAAKREKPFSHLSLSIFPMMIAFSDCLCLHLEREPGGRHSSPRTQSSGAPSLPVPSGSPCPWCLAGNGVLRDGANGLPGLGRTWHALTVSLLLLLPDLCTWLNGCFAESFIIRCEQEGKGIRG